MKDNIYAESKRSIDHCHLEDGYFGQPVCDDYTSIFVAMNST